MNIDTLFSLEGKVAVITGGSRGLGKHFARAFIASGAVELESAGQTWRLGRGEMFGQMAILTQRSIRAEAHAIAPTTLLVLDEDRFRRLIVRSKALRKAVRASAEKRGIEPAGLLPDADKGS